MCAHTDVHTHWWGIKYSVNYKDDTKAEMAHEEDKMGNADK